MAGMHHALMLASRIAAGIVGTIAFYLAFFLYEDEEGVWQNRVEQLWVAVYDRAKITDSVSTALFNKIAQVVRRCFDHIFGRPLFSLRFLFVSTNISFLGGMLLTTLGAISANWYTLSGNFWITNSTDTALVILPIMLIFVILPLFFTKPWSTPIFGFPLLVFMAHTVSDLWDGQSPSFVAGELIMVALSVTSDCIAVLAIRRIFTSISAAVSFGRLIDNIGLLILLIIAILIFPAFLRFDAWNSGLEELWVELWLMNITTLIILLLPLPILLIVMMHRIIWPLLSRFLYPVASRKIITNRAAMVPFGAFCAMYAFNLEHIGAKELLKMIAK